jgi:hypothetical protein
MLERLIDRLNRIAELNDAVFEYLVQQGRSDGYYFKAREAGELDDKHTTVLFGAGTSIEEAAIDAWYRIPEDVCKRFRYEDAPWST